MKHYLRELLNMLELDPDQRGSVIGFSSIKDCKGEGLCMLWLSKKFCLVREEFESILQPVISALQELVWKRIEIGQLIFMKYRINGKNKIPTSKQKGTASGLIFSISVVAPYNTKNKVDPKTAKVTKIGYRSFSNCPWLFTNSLSALTERFWAFLVIYPTTKILHQKIHGAAKNSAREELITIPTKNIRFQKLSLVQSFTNIIFTLFETHINTMVSFIKVQSKGFFRLDLLF